MQAHTNTQKDLTENEAILTTQASVFFEENVEVIDILLPDPTPILKDYADKQGIEDANSLTAEQKQQALLEAVNIEPVKEEAKPIEEEQPKVMGYRPHLFPPGYAYTDFRGNQYMVDSNGAERRINKPVSKKKRKRLEAAARKNGK